MTQPNPADLVRSASTSSTLWGVLLIILGMLAVGSPYVAAVAVNVAIAWLIVLAGMVHIIAAFYARSAGSLIWKIVVGAAYIVLGIYLIMQPVTAVASLTLLLSCLFLIEGIFAIVVFFQIRSIRGSSWILLDGAVTLVLGG